jgi:hypothetical protein
MSIVVFDNVELSYVTFISRNTLSSKVTLKGHIFEWDVYILIMAVDNYISRYEETRGNAMVHTQLVRLCCERLTD